MSKSNKKFHYFIFLLILTSLIFTGCSNNKNEKNDLIIVNGKIEIPDLRESHQTEVSESILNISSIKESVFNAPIETAQFKPQEYIIKLNKNIDENQLQNSILKETGRVVNKLADDMYKISLNEINNEVIETLQRKQEISYIEPDYQVHIQKIPNDPGYEKQWNLKILGLESVWNDFQGSSNVTVAVIDTGILPDHPDLKGNIVPGYDFIDHDNDPTDPDPEFSHGTHVAGIIGAMTNNSTGIAGINWHISIMPVRIIGKGGTGDYSALIAGIHWAVDNGADIINLSLAGSIDSISLREAINYAIDHNVTIVAAAGNYGSSPILYPAQYPEVISVGAIGPTKERAYYSNFGSNLDLVAPGGDSTILTHQYNTILSTAGYLQNYKAIHQYTWAQGTSMATPHVSGLIALLYSRGINNPVEIKQILKETADDLGPAGEDIYYGAGLINISKALEYTGWDNEFDEGDPSTIKILASNKETSQQVTTFTDLNKKTFSLALSRGGWTIKASYNNYFGEIDIYVPGDNNIIINLSLK